MFCANIWLGKLSITHKSPPRTSSVYQFDGTLYVENESFNKVVGVHCEIDGVWHDVLAIYSESLLTRGGNLVEAWKLNASLSSSVNQSHVRLAAFYNNVDWHISHWDNNNGSDYFIAVVHEA